MGALVLTGTIPALGQTGPPGVLGLQVKATDFYIEALDLPNGRAFSAEADDLSPAADTVLHLFRWDSSLGYKEVAFNDEWGAGLRSRVTYRPSCTEDFDAYLLVARAKYSHTGGSANLFPRFGGAVPILHEADIPVGGMFVPLVDAPSDPARRSVAVEVPGGASQSRVVALDSDGRALSTSSASPGVGGGSRIMGDADMTALFVGAQRFREEGGVAVRLSIEQCMVRPDGSFAADLTGLRLICARP